MFADEIGCDVMDIPPDPCGRSPKQLSADPELGRPGGVGGKGRGSAARLSRTSTLVCVLLEIQVVDDVAAVPVLSME